MENQKRFYRQLKRSLKKTGNRNVRNYLKRQLHDNPLEAHWAEYSFGHHSTEGMNGEFHDRTRDRDDGYPDEDIDRY